MLHAVGVAGENHDQIVTIVLHHLEQDLDRLLPVVPLVLRSVQVVGLIDEQDAAHGPLEHLFGLRSRVTDVLPHQVITADGDQP